MRLVMTLQRALANYNHQSGNHDHTNLHQDNSVDTSHCKVLICKSGGNEVILGHHLAVLKVAWNSLCQSKYPQKRQTSLLGTSRSSSTTTGRRSRINMVRTSSSSTTNCERTPWMENILKQWRKHRLLEAKPNLHITGVIHNTHEKPHHFKTDLRVIQ